MLKSAITFKNNPFNCPRIYGSLESLEKMGISILEDNTATSSGWSFEEALIKFKNPKFNNVIIIWNEDRDCCDLSFNNGVDFAYISDSDFIRNVSRKSIRQMLDNTIGNHIKDNLELDSISILAFNESNKFHYYYSSFLNDDNIYDLFVDIENECGFSFNDDQCENLKNWTFKEIIDWLYIELNTSSDGRKVKRLKKKLLPPPFPTEYDSYLRKSLLDFG